MAVAAEQHLKIAADQLAAIHLGSDLLQLELIGGEVFVNPAPRTWHGIAVARLFERLVAASPEQRFGQVLTAPTDVRLSPRDVVQPDVLFVATARLGIITDECVLGAPDLVVEVLSPSTRDRDLGPKRDLYERSGVREYWLVDPEARTVTLLALEGGRHAEVPPQDGRVRSTVLADLVVDPANLFPSPDETA